MLRRVAPILFVILLVGCSGAPQSSPTEPTLVEAQTGVHVIGIDGYWSIPVAAALRAAESAGYSSQELGVAIQGEASFGAVAAPILALDSKAAALVGAPTPPSPGEIVISQNLSEKLGAKVGDSLALRASAWPASMVLSAFEMERVRPCTNENAASLCSLEQNAAGESQLRLTVGKGSFDLQFHPDVVELGPDDYPAFWNGSFIAPSGAVLPFATGAFSRSETLPPGGVAGSIEDGAWTIAFTIDANHTRAPGAIAGFVTLRTPGYSPFNVDLLRLPASRDQTTSFLANATQQSATLRVASIATVPSASALLSLADARQLLAVGNDNATALLSPARASSLVDSPFRDDPQVGPLRARSWPPMRADIASEGALVLWAPPDLDLSALPRVAGAGAPALSAASTAPLAPARFKDTNVTGVRLLALPTGEPPWRLAARAFWADSVLAEKGMATGPHLVLLSSDILTSMGLPVDNATYVKTDFETALGSRTVFGMGAVLDGPTKTVWASSALATASGGTLGARLIVPIVAGADRASVERAALDAWAPFGVALLTAT